MGGPQLLTKWDDPPSSSSGKWKLIEIPESRTNKWVIPVVTIAGRGLYPMSILQFQSLIQFSIFYSAASCFGCEFLVFVCNLGEEDVKTSIPPCIGIDFIAFYQYFDITRPETPKRSQDKPRCSNGQLQHPTHWWMHWLVKCIQHQFST